MVTNSVGSVGDVSTPAVPNRKFAGNDVFEIDTDTFSKFTFGKRPYVRWAKYMDLDDPHSKRIKEYCMKHNKKSIILQDSKTKAMIYLRKK